MDKEIHYQLWFEFGFDFTLSLDLWHENVCFCIEFNCVDKKLAFKVHIFWEGHKILQNLHLTFDWHYIGQKEGEDFAKFCGLLRIYEL